MPAKPEADLHARPGTLLGGRVRYDQWPNGYRTGIEPVLLAAAIPARAGQRVVEAGSGAGAGLLCLAARVPGVTGVGIERDERLAQLAKCNARQNLWHDRLDFIAAPIETYAATASGAGFAHALANPPWHDPAVTRSADAGRAAAKRAHAGLLHDWAGALARLLIPRGTLTLMLAPANLDAALAACTAHGLGSIRLLPFWPRDGKAAKILLVQAIRGGRGPTTLLAGFALHDVGGYSAAAHSILQDGAALPTGTR